jgi:hypothetical protein
MRKASSMRTNKKTKLIQNSGLCCGFTERERERDKFGKTGSGERVSPPLAGYPRLRWSSNAPSVITTAALKQHNHAWAKKKGSTMFRNVSNYPPDDWVYHSGGL